VTDKTVDERLTEDKHSEETLVEKNPTSITVKVQTEDFDLQQGYLQVLNNEAVSGAVVTFTGLVRDFNDGRKVTGLALEHYPGMTEKSLLHIAEQASDRWSLEAITVIHRVGKLSLGDQIVLVAVASKHRGDAFAACEFMMDFLKTKAPFWKKETTENGDIWVEAKSSDEEKASSWN
jgi:molybdopterin synthase catalytic subunit